MYLVELFIIKGSNDEVGVCCIEYCGLVVVGFCVVVVDVGWYGVVFLWLYELY